MTNLEEHTTIKNNDYRRFINCIPLIYKLADMHILKHFSLLYACIILFINSIHAQSMSDYPYQKLYDSASALLYTNPELALKINNRILKKAKSESNIPFLVRAYGNAAVLAEYPIGNSYIDSVIDLGDKIPVDMKYPTRAYILKGYLSYINEDYIESFNYFTLANQSAITHNHQDLKYDISIYIATIKLNWGQHEEAALVYQEQLDYLKNIEEKNESQKQDYILALINLIIAKNHSKDYFSVLNLIPEAEKLSIDYADSSLISSVQLNKAISLFHTNNIDLAQKVLDSINYFNDSDFTANIYLYQGQILAKKNNYSDAILKLNKMDSLATLTNSSNPDLRHGYETLLEIYKSQNNSDKLVATIDKLFHHDSLVSIDSDYLNTNFYSKYDKVNLIHEKNKALNSSLIQRRNKLIILYSAIGLFIILISFYFYNQNKQKNNFAKLLASISQKTKEPPFTTNITINDELQDELLLKLNRFERNKEFTDPTITLSNLASELNTNSTYLSKFINEAKGVSFSEYLKTLRIDHATNILLEHKKFRSYTIEALAEEFGFKSGNSFSKAFILITKMKPSEFIKQASKRQQRTTDNL